MATALHHEPSYQASLADEQASAMRPKSAPGVASAHRSGLSPVTIGVSVMAATIAAVLVLTMVMVLALTEVSLLAAFGFGLYCAFWVGTGFGTVFASAAVFGGEH